MDLISVVVPIYKVEKYLGRCVNSILCQTYKNIEIILVDDGSPDNCPKLCDDLANDYPNISVIHKKNGGASSARNAGIDACHGRYLSFIDSDDFIDREFLKRLYCSVVNHNAGLAMVQYAEVSSDENLTMPNMKKELLFVGDAVERAFLELKVESVCVGLYSLDTIRDHRFIEGKTSEDILFNFEVFKELDTFVYIPEKRYYYFYNSKSISNGVLDKHMFNYLYFRHDIYEYYKGQNDSLTVLAEALYARAAMGLQTRMVLYGISDELNEQDCKQQFTSIFDKHKNAFFSETSIPVSRKMIAIIVFRLYSILRMLRGYKK